MVPIEWWVCRGIRNSSHRPTWYVMCAVSLFDTDWRRYIGNFLFVIMGLRRLSPF
jgi:hypothetical protein